MINPAFNILNGRYVIPVPRGNHALGVEPVDGSPAPAESFNLTCQIGALFGQQNFNEEFWNNNSENGVELRLGQRKEIPIQPGRTQSGINITTADSINLNNFGNRDRFGFFFVPAGFLCAVQIPGSQIASINPGQDILIQGVAFETSVFNHSVAPIYAQAALTTGVVNPDDSVTIDLANPLEVTAGFLGQDDDFAPFYFNEPQALGRRVRSAIAEGAIENLFIVLQIPTTTPFAGVSGFPPRIGLDGGVAVNDAPIFGRSFFSYDGGATWGRDTRFNYRFSLVLSRPVTPPGQQ